MRFSYGFSSGRRSLLSMQTILTPIQLMAYPLGGFRLFMAQGAQKADHVWLVMIKAMHALTRYAAAGIEGTGLGNSDFRVLEVLLHKGPLPVNTIGPIVNLTPGSISIAVERLVEKGLVSRVESAEDRRVRMVALTPAGKNLIVPAFQKHAAQMRRVFSDLSAEELRDFEMALKRIGRRAAGLMEISSGESRVEEGDQQ